MRRARWVLGLVVTVVTACQATPQVSERTIPEQDRNLNRRMAMVRQIVAMGVADSLTLSAMRRVPRHEFVLPGDVDKAYTNRALRIAQGQTISQPYLVAHMTEIVRAVHGMKVLEVGTGSGYQAAVLAAIGCEVFTIEINAVLADSATRRLARLGYDNVEVRHGDGYLGWPEEEPFDAIIVTAAPPELPDVLVQQLARGGRLVVPVGGVDAVQSLTLVTRDRSGIVTVEEGLPVRFVPMVRGR